MPDPADERGDRARFEGRISDLDKELGKVKARRDAERASDRDAEVRGKGMAYGMSMAAGLVSAIIVGGLIGYVLDWLLGTKPWLFLLFFVLGFAAGILNVVRGYKKIQADYMKRSGGNIGHSVPDDDED